MLSNNVQPLLVGANHSKDVNIYFYGLLSSPEENEVVLLEWPMAAGIVW